MPLREPTIDYSLNSDLVPLFLGQNIIDRTVIFIGEYPQSYLEDIKFKNIGNTPLFIKKIEGEFFDKIDEKIEGGNKEDLKLPIRIDPQEEKTFIVHVKKDLILNIDFPTNITLTTNEIGNETRTIVVDVDPSLYKRESELKFNPLVFEDVPNSISFNYETDEDIYEIYSLQDNGNGTLTMITEADANSVAVKTLISIGGTKDENGLYEVISYELIDDGTSDPSSLNDKTSQLKVVLKGSISSKDINKQGYWTYTNIYSETSPILKGTIQHIINQNEFDTLDKETMYNTFFDFKDDSLLEEVGGQFSIKEKYFNNNANLSTKDYNYFKVSIENINNSIKESFYRFRLQVDESETIVYGWCPGVTTGGYFYSKSAGAIKIDHVISTTINYSQNTIDIIFLSLQNTYSGLSGINYGIMNSFTDKGIFCSQYAELAFRNTGENDLQMYAPYITSQREVEINPSIFVEGADADAVMNFMGLYNIINIKEEIFLESGSFFDGDNLSSLTIPAEQEIKVAFTLGSNKIKGDFSGYLNCYYKTIMTLFSAGSDPIRLANNVFSINTSKPKISVFENNVNYLGVEDREFFQGRKGNISQIGTNIGEGTILFTQSEIKNNIQYFNFLFRF